MDGKEYNWKGIQMKGEEDIRDSEAEKLLLSYEESVVHMVGLFWTEPRNAFGEVNDTVREAMISSNEKRKLLITRIRHLEGDI